MSANLAYGGVDRFDSELADNGPGLQLTGLEVPTSFSNSSFCHWVFSVAFEAFKLHYGLQVTICARDYDEISLSFFVCH